MINEIKHCIEQQLPQATVYVSDPHNDGQHFESIVICPSFETLSLVKQHQVVMNALKEKFNTTVHALALKTFTPTKWKSEQHKYKGV